MIPERRRSQTFMANPSSSALRRRLREAASEELGQLLAEVADALDPPALRQIFANPFLDAELIERLFDLPGVERSYEARREAVRHVRTPRALALKFVGGLYWVDLIRIGLDARLHPVVRRAADLRLIERLPTLAVGEKIAIARAADAAVLAALRHDPSAPVIAALLDNARTTETLLMPFVASERASPLALGAVARSARWASRPVLRAALCRNPALPLPQALALLPGLGKRELRAVAADPRLSPALRRKAGFLGADRGASPGRKAGSGRAD